MKEIVRMPVLMGLFAMVMNMLMNKIRLKQ
jgi:hypothetical protein